MAELIESPVRVEAAGQPPKTIEEFTGRASTGETRASIARMRSAAGRPSPVSVRNSTSSPSLAPLIY
jgi:hypothetical protein